MRSQLHHLAHPMLTLSGLLLVVGSPFVILARFDERPFSRIALGAPYLAGSALTLAACACLAIGLAGLVDHTGPQGRRLGGPAMAAALIGVMGAVYLTAINVFIAPWLANVAPATIDGEYDGAFMAGWLGALVLNAIGMIWLGASGFRARVLPRSAAILIALGAPIGFLVGDFPGVLTGVGLLWAGIAGLRPHPDQSA
jgi:hypothetical protein